MDNRVEQHAECVEGMMKDRSQKVCGRMFRMSPETIGLSASGRYAGRGIAVAVGFAMGTDPMKALKNWGWRGPAPEGFCGEVSRAGDRPRGLAQWEEKTTVVIYCGNHV